MQSNRYPQIRIRSKNELAKHISSKDLPVPDALRLINDVLANYDTYWHDHPTRSEPDKGKWVRDASRSNLGKLLKLIDRKVLRPHDNQLPNIAFGGVSGKNHKAAVQHLLGRKRQRMILKMDIEKFFEQNDYERVYKLFRGKMMCSSKGAKLLADLCCVPYGPKDRPENLKTIARGFPTSPRLAVWCNLDAFIKLERRASKELNKHDPRIAVYVDDIGITASKVAIKDMMLLFPKLKDILEADRTHKLPLNEKKTKIVNHTGDTYDSNGNFVNKRGFEWLGIQMNRNSLTLGTKTRWKLANITQKFKDTDRQDSKLRKSRRSLIRYKNYIEK